MWTTNDGGDDAEEAEQTCDYCDDDAMSEHEELDGGDDVD